MTIQVTRTFLPPLADFQRLVEGVWARGQITNHGPLVLELEARLREHLGVRHCLLVANGTLALQIAIRALELDGDVVTTPFSYVATTSSLVWERCRPVFADIDPATLCLDPAAAARALTPGTRGILATHVYGNACDVERLGELAARRDLRVIYDAAHAFGVRLHGRPLCAWGDVATLSFHATKLFHTVEGGALVTADDALAARIAQLRNFGHDGPEAFSGLGINAKVNELQAAMGLAVLPPVPDLIARRRAASQRYDALLAGAPLSRPRLHEGLEYNFAYHPVLFESEAALLAARDALRAADVQPRRYFYPALHRLPYVESGPLPVAESAAARVLCLPLSADLALADVERIAGIVRRTLGA